MAEPYGKQSHFHSVSSLANLDPPAWLIEGICETQSLVMVAGPPGSYKTFLVLDWALHLVTGRKWQERASVPSQVLYLIGEGKAAFFKRILAWQSHHKLTEAEKTALETNFRVGFDVPQMVLKDSVDQLLANLRDEEASGFAPGVIVIDTFARSFVGYDENSSRDTGMWIDQADRLRQIGFTVIFLHHTRKNSDFGQQYRGSTAIMGAMDTALTLEKDKSDILTVTMTKQKDHEEEKPLFFTKRSVPVYHDTTLLTESGMVLERTVKLSDERMNNPRLDQEEAAIDALLKDPDLESDNARARVLASRFQIPLETARTKIRRRKKERVGAVDLVQSQVQVIETDQGPILVES